MDKQRWRPTAEQYTLIGISISLCIAALATKLPVIAFGSFQHMAAILVASDLVLYAAFKLQIVKGVRTG